MLGIRGRRNATVALPVDKQTRYSSIALNQVPASDGTLTRALRKPSCPVFRRAPTDRFELSSSRERGRQPQSQPSSPHKRSGNAAPPLRPFGGVLGSSALRSFSRCRRTSHKAPEDSALHGRWLKIPYLGTSERAWIWFATMYFKSPMVCLTADIDPAARHTGTRDGCPSSRHVGETTPRVPTQHLSRGTTRELVILLGVRKGG